MRVTIDGAEYADTKEAANIAGYSEEHIRRLARHGNIESVKDSGRVFVLVSSLEKYTQAMKALGNQRFSPWRD